MVRGPILPSRSLRFAALVAVVGVLCAPREAGATVPCSTAPSDAPASSAVLEAAVARLPSSPELETGAIGDALIGQLVEAACGEKARPWLPGTCVSPGPRGIGELRRRLVGDIARLPAIGLERYAADAPEARAAARAALAVIDTVLADGSIDTLARTLAGSVCVSVPGVSLPEVEAAGRVLAKVLDAPPSDSVEEQARRIEAVLRAEGLIPEGEKLSPARRDAVKELAEALAASVAEQRGSSSKPSTSAAIQRSFEVAAAVVTLARGSAFTIPTKWVSAIITLAEGDIDAAIEAQLTLFIGTGADGKRSEAGEAVRTGLRIASAQSKDEVIRILRSKVLGPWSDPFLFDINLVKPVVSRDNVQFGGDLAIGYVGRKFGVRVHGSYSSYNLDDGRKLSLTNKLAGGNDIWFAFGDAKTRFDGRLAAELALYDTKIVDRGVGAGTTFGSEASLDYRGSVLLGLRHEPNNRFAMAVWAGMGVQYEVHYPIELATGTPVLNLAVSGAASLLLQARFRAQYQVYPGYLAARFQSDLQRYSVVSAALGLTADATGLHLNADARRAVQLEWRTRVFFDAEVARFFGMVPGLTTGFDFIHLRDEASVSTFVPIFGVGIRRTTM